MHTPQVTCASPSPIEEKDRDICIRGQMNICGAVNMRRIKKSRSLVTRVVFILIQRKGDMSKPDCSWLRASEAEVLKKGSAAFFFFFFF
jgi:hypothetical protein